MTVHKLPLGAAGPSDASLRRHAIDGYCWCGQNHLALSSLNVQMLAEFYPHRATRHGWHKQGRTWFPPGTMRITRPDRPDPWACEDDVRSWAGALCREYDAEQRLFAHVRQICSVMLEAHAQAAQDAWRSAEASGHMRRLGACTVMVVHGDRPSPWDIAAAAAEEAARQYIQTCLAPEKASSNTTIGRLDEGGGVNG